MTRDKLIITEAKKYYSENIQCYDAFLHGVQFAEEHPINVWHNSSEEPQGDSEILFDGVGYSIIYGIESDLDKSGIDWKELVKDHCIQRWAYIDDLLPKGGEQ